MDSNHYIQVVFISVTLIEGIQLRTGIRVDVFIPMQNLIYSY